MPVDSFVTPVRIRPLTAADIDHVLYHRRAMFRDMGNTDEEVLARVDRSGREYFERAISSGGYCGWFAETEAHEIVAGIGIVIADWPGSPFDNGPRRAWILNVFTEPAWRRRGIARRLMTTAVEWCRSQGFRMVALHASAEGRPLYASMGFQPTNEMRLTLVERGPTA